MSDTPDTETENQPLEGLRILIAEDNPDNVVLATAILQQAGAEVGVAWNGAQAVDQGLRRAGGPGSPDVILMDLMMPVMDGWAATRQLRASGYGGRIVALTALEGPDHRRSCLESGCDDYLAKPYDPDRLLELLRQTVAPMREPSVIREPIEPELFARLKGGFVKRLALTARRLRMACDAGDVERLLVLTHSLKGSAGTYGHSRISRRAHDAHARLEAEGDDRGVAALLIEIDVALARGRIGRS